MDFDDTPQEAIFRAEAQAFLEEHAELLAPGDPGSRWDNDSAEAVAAAQKWQALKQDHGWACLSWPVEYGGRGAAPIESIIFAQEEARYRTPPNIFAIGIGMLGPTLMAHGRPDQTERFLGKLARGEEIWCQLFSEPSAGSDLAGLRSSAVRAGDGWRINGQKIWTSGAHYSRWGMMVVRTDPNVPKHDGLTYFIIDMQAEGIEIRPIKQINGAANFSEVFFSDVKVEDESRLDAVGNGWRVAITTLMNERASISAGGFGPRSRDLLELAHKVEINGRPAIEDSYVRQRIAAFHARLRGIEHTGNRTLTALSRGQIPGPEASIGKLAIGVLGQEVASFGMELQGLAGAEMDPNFGYQDAYLNSPAMRLAGGTDEILHNIVAERVLGLPAEPRTDKAIPFREVPTGRS